MSTGILGTIGAVGTVVVDEPPDEPPTPGAFAPTKLEFDQASYAPGSTITATVTGTPATDGSLPTVTLTDSSGRTWAKTGQTADTITATASVSSEATGGTATLTVKTEPGAGKISGKYTVDKTTPPSGDYPIPYLEAVPAGSCGAGFCNVVAVL